MKIFIMEETPQIVIIYLRAEGEGIVGDARFEILPGQDFQGRSFEELRKMGVGRHEIK